MFMSFMGSIQLLRMEKSYVLIISTTTEVRYCRITNMVVGDANGRSSIILNS